MISQFFSSAAPAVLLQEPGTLGVVRYDGEPFGSPLPGCISVGLPALSDGSCEVIRIDSRDILRGCDGRVQWSCGGEVMLAALSLAPAQCEQIEQAAQSAYQDLFAVLKRKGHPNVFRLWNFLPQINRGDGDAEVYKRFCVGRERGFAASGIDARCYPAASALGHRLPGAVIYALASATPVVHHENPRQQPAYRYPREYGPSSPSFARASSIDLGGSRHIFVSGTASILGHESRSVGNLADQLEITLSNIQHLLAGVDSNFAPLSAVRVYLRHAAHYAVAKQIISGVLPEADVSFVVADICRANLLVEVEGATRSLS